MRFWGSIYETSLAQYLVVNPEAGTGNMSPESDGVYILPNRISYLNNLLIDGYNWCEAHYLSPLAQSVFRQTATGDKTDLSTANVYQNPGWPMVDGQTPISVK